jgi:hypothetical protein
MWFVMVAVYWRRISSVAPGPGGSTYGGALGWLVGLVFSVGGVSGSGGPQGGDGGRRVSSCGYVEGGVLVRLVVLSGSSDCMAVAAGGEGGGRCSRTRCVASCCSWLMSLSSRYRPSFVMWGSAPLVKASVSLDAPVSVI